LKSETTKKQTECQFILVQRIRYPKTGESYTGILSNIASFLRVKLNILKARNRKACDQYKVKVGSVKSKSILRVYLNKYPLLSTKLLDYKAWCSADDLMLQKLHYTEQGAKEITKTLLCLYKVESPYPIVVKQPFALLSRVLACPIVVKQPFALLSRVLACLPYFVFTK
jgi:hypothetical protein